MIISPASQASCSGWHMFKDLKHAGMVEQSWMRIVISAIATTLVLGLGVAMGLGWLCREDVLVHKRHKGAAIKG